MSNPTYGKDVLNLTELSKEEIITIVELGISMKKDPAAYSTSLQGKILGMIFEKASTRTRVSFEAGIIQLGGAAIVLNASDTQIGRGEPVKDTGNVLSGYLDAIMIRAYSDEMVGELAKYASIPVISGLTDDHHPCQILADFMTIYEYTGTFENQKLAYVGDGNNMAHSLMIGAAITGMDISIASPKGYEVKPEFVKIAEDYAKVSGSKIVLTDDPKLACGGANFLITDVWASMGWEEEAKAREAAFAGKYQINAELGELAAPDYKFLHCLPAHRGEEVTAEIIDGPHSVIYQEAENRLHAQKALLHQVLKA